MHLNVREIVKRIKVPNLMKMDSYSAQDKKGCYITFLVVLRIIMKFQQL